jgi:hypothetical protein
MARVATPRGWITKLRKVHGEIHGKCFRVCLTFASAFPSAYWYCEGLADGMPHAWVSPKYIGKERTDLPWAIDPTWGWRYPVSKRIFDHANYLGVRLNGSKVQEFLLNRSDKQPTSASILKYIDEVSLEDLA